MIGSSSAIAKRRRVGASHEIAESSRLRGSRGRSYDATTTSGARAPGLSGARQPTGPIAHDATSARSVHFVRLAIAGAEDILDSPELHLLHDGQRTELHDSERIERREHADEP